MAGHEQTGLYRYDGYTFQRYLREPGDPASLSADRVFTVYQDHRGTLWVRTPAGLDRVDPTQDGFTHYRYDAADDRGLSGAALEAPQAKPACCGSARPVGSTEWIPRPAASPTIATIHATTRPSATVPGGCPA